MFETDIDEGRDHTGSFLYLSIPLYWYRELLLSHRAKHWQLMEARIESASRSVGGYQETIRLEVRYSYTFNGDWYSGYLVRDTCFPFGVKAALARYREANRVQIWVNPDNPNESYLPSGLPWIEPFLTSFVSFGCVALFLFIIIDGILSAMSH